MLQHCNTMEIKQLTQRGLERRLKRRLTSRLQKFAVITTPGFEPVTREEIESVVNPSGFRLENGILEFEAPFDAVYRLNLHLRTASRILLRIDSFTARSYPELFNKLHRIPWELHTGFHPDIGFVVSSRSSRMHHTGTLCKTVFDAINDYMVRMGVKKTCVKTSPHTVFVRMHEDRCTLSMDTTGPLLYKRGYRPNIAGAPLRETTAAALLIASHWERYEVIADPCCGSGGIIIEALRMASGIPPGSRRDFAFTSWPAYSVPHWNHCRKIALQEGTGRSVRLFAGDINEKAITSIERNLSSVSDPEVAIHSEVRCADCLEFNRDGAYGRNGLLISNLPFGKRISVDGGIRHFHRSLGVALRKHCAGWSFGFLVADPQFERQSGLKCTTALVFRNGGIPVRFVTGKIPG
ncbi:MAG: hypothetical protein JW863_12115 [Chitinispirillaceae bacterium]|nr:hypothetical protein [Chitinispirillaceae bacterium]